LFEEEFNCIYAKYRNENAFISFFYSVYGWTPDASKLDMIKNETKSQKK
jgi:hypothetical protein